MENEAYTLGEVAREGMLYTLQGKKIHDRAYVSRIARKLGTVTLKTKYGTAKCLTPEQIKEYNLTVVPLLVDTSLGEKFN